jgi:hypothetical protein
MPFLPFGKKIFLQELKRVVSHFIIGNHQAFPSDSSKQPVPELHAHNITYFTIEGHTITNNFWVAAR